MQFHEVRRTHIQNCKNKVTERSNMMSTSVPEFKYFKMSIVTMETKEKKGSVKYGDFFCNY